MKLSSVFFLSCFKQKPNRIYSTEREIFLECILNDAKNAMLLSRFSGKKSQANWNMNNRNKLNKSLRNEQNLLPTDQLFHAH